MRTGKKAVLGFTFALATVLIVAATAWWVFARSFTLSLTGVDFEPLVALTKKTVADFVVVKQPNGSSTQASRHSAYYKQSREEFQADAKLFDTWATATRLADSVLEHGPSGDWVRSSSEIEYVRPEDRLDPWGHPLCLLRRGSLLLVISGGPNAPGSPACKNVRMTIADLDKFPQKKLLQSPTGSLILVADKASLPLASQSEK